MRSLIAALVLLAATASAQTPANDYLDSFGITRQKNYTSHRVSSSNRNVLSNDDSKKIMPGDTLVMADLTGPGMVTHIWLTVADNEYGWPRLARIRVYYDDAKTPSVDVPLGDFFGVGHGAERNLNSMMIHNSSFGRARNSYWPMPYRKRCRITVTNEGHRVVPMFYYHVDYRTYAAMPDDLAYFHAYYRQERPARAGKNYEFLNINGTGHYVGTVMSVIQTQLSWFGEGDDLFFVDGATKPQIVGTGSEDYFLEAWGLRDTDGPWSGTPIAEGERLGSRLTGYRWHVPDPVAFTKSLWAGIEHAGWTANPDGTFRSSFEERPDFFSSAAFWYQKGVQQGLPEPPFGDERLPFGNAIQIAIEASINEVTTEKGKAEVRREVDWAKDILYFDAEGAGSRINIPIAVKEAGRYEIVAQVAQGPDYGDYKVLLNGEETNLDTRKAETSEIPFPGPEIFRNYLGEYYVARDRAIGMFDLKQGRHILTFVCMGKDSRSVGYGIGIQDVVLQRVLETEADAKKPVAAYTHPETAAGPVYRGHTLPFYRSSLQAASGFQKADLLRQIGFFGADAGQAIPDLATALSDSSPEVRTAAATGLAEIGPAARSALPSLTKALADTDPQVRAMSAAALKYIGPAAAPAIPELVKLLDDPVDYVRAQAAYALGAMGASGGPGAKALGEHLIGEEKTGYVLGAYAYALADIGPAAKDALPSLEKAVAMKRALVASQRAIAKIKLEPVQEYY